MVREPREYPFVSLIAPCRNEEKYIRACLDTILANDYPQHRLEILVVDGMSEDATREIAGAYANRHPFIQFLDNPKRNVCAAMNRGLKEVKGEVIFKIDTHSTYPKDYISKCVKHLYQTGVENVGGKFVLSPGGNTFMAKSIAAAMAHPFGIGKYYQWMDSLKSATEVETVSFGCYRKEFLDRNHLRFNENMARGGDAEFNAQLRKAGGKILLIPEIIFHYYGRPNLKEFCKHQFSYGFWNLHGVKFGAKVTSRALIPLIASLALIGIAALSLFFIHFFHLLISLILVYAAINLYYSLKIAFQQKDARFLFTMPLVFGTLHLSYSSGVLTSAWQQYASLPRPFIETKA